MCMIMKLFQYIEYNKHLISSVATGGLMLNP